MQRHVASPLGWSPMRRHRSVLPRPALLLTIVTLILAVSTVLVTHSWMSPTTHAAPAGSVSSGPSPAAPAARNTDDGAAPEVTLRQAQPQPPGSGVGWHHVLKKHRTAARAGHRTLRTGPFLLLLAFLSMVVLARPRGARGHGDLDLREAFRHVGAGRCLRAPPAPVA